MGIKGTKYKGVIMDILIIIVATAVALNDFGDMKNMMKNTPMI